MRSEAILKSFFKPKAYLGVDPGKSGALVVLYNGKAIAKQPMPLLGDDIHIRGLQSFLSAVGMDYDLTVILEDVHSLFGASSGSTFQFGFTCGVIEAVIVCLGMKLIKVSPKKWQGEVWDNGDKCYKPKKAEQKNPSIDTKATSLKSAVRLFPNEDLRATERSKKAHDGVVDALLLAEYARRKNL